MFYIQKYFDTKIDIHYYRFGINNKDPGFCKQKAIKVYMATQGTISRSFSEFEFNNYFSYVLSTEGFCYRDRHANKFDLFKCSKRRVIDLISVGQNLKYFYIVQKKHHMDILEFRHPQINGIQYRVFLADEFENFSPVAIPCPHNNSEKK